jgi:hypothetical protein
MTTDPKPLTPAVVITEHVVFAFAVVPALPPGADVLVLVREGANGDTVCAALQAAKAEGISYGLPTSRVDFAQRWPSTSKGRARRVDFPLEIGLEPAPPPPPRRPARWENPYEMEAQAARNQAAAEAQRRIDEEEAQKREAAGEPPASSSTIVEPTVPVLTVAEMDAQAASLAQMKREIEDVRIEREREKKRTRHRDNDEPPTPPKAA